MNPKQYDQMLNDEGFLNDLWELLGATDKIQALKLAGFDLDKAWAEYIEAKADDHEI